MALLTAGWPLVNAVVADRQPLAAGTRLVIGNGTRSSAVVTVGRGWSVLPEQSNPIQGYLLRHGAVELSILHVDLVNSSAGAHVCGRACARSCSVSNPGVRLSQPSDHFHTARGLPGISGASPPARKVGTATIVRRSVEAVRHRDARACPARNQSGDARSGCPSCRISAIYGGPPVTQAAASAPAAPTRSPEHPPGPPHGHRGCAFRRGRAELAVLPVPRGVPGAGGARRGPGAPAACDRLRAGAAACGRSARRRWSGRPPRSPGAARPRPAARCWRTRA